MSKDKEYLEMYQKRKQVATRMLRDAIREGRPDEDLDTLSFLVVILEEKVSKRQEILHQQGSGQ